MMFVWFVQKLLFTLPILEPVIFQERAYAAQPKNKCNSTSNQEPAPKKEKSRDGNLCAQINGREKCCKQGDADYDACIISLCADTQFAEQHQTSHCKDIQCTNNECCNINQDNCKTRLCQDNTFKQRHYTDLCLPSPQDLAKQAEQNEETEDVIEDCSKLKLNPKSEKVADTIFKDITLCDLTLASRLSQVLVCNFKNNYDRYVELEIQKMNKNRTDLTIAGTWDQFIVYGSLSGQRIRFDKINSTPLFGFSCQQILNKERTILKGLCAIVDGKYATDTCHTDKDLTKAFHYILQNTTQHKLTCTGKQCAISYTKFY